MYENALFIELCSLHFIVEKQKAIDVFYADKRVGEYYADLIVNDIVIVEIKAHECLLTEHENQLINYLKATQIESWLVIKLWKKAGSKKKDV